MSPAAMSPALDQLGRLLWLLAAAGRPEGVPMDEACRALGIDRPRLRRDVEMLTRREFYLPRGSTQTLQVWEDADDRLHVRGGPVLAGPLRLTPREALALALALRGTGEGGATLASLERRLAARAEAGDFDLELGLPLVLADLHPDPVGIRQTVVQAVRERRVCSFGYLKEGAEAPERRSLHTYVLSQAEGRWYAVGHDPEADGRRVFRVDRMLAARLEEERFEVPADFDPAEVHRGGQVFVRPDGNGTGLEAEVRYDASVAAWVREMWPHEVDGDGSVRVRHAVHDPGWLVRHVLGWGTEAELLSPARLRRLVGEAALRLAES